MTRPISTGSSVGFAILAATFSLSTAAYAQQAPAKPLGPPQAGDRLARLPSLPFPDAPSESPSLDGSLRVIPFVKGLVNPWSLAFLPNGDMLVTEKPGRLRLVRSNGTLESQPIGGTPSVLAMGQGGLLDVALHPRFAENQLVYLTYSKPGDAGNTTALARGRLNGMTLTDVKDIFVADAWSKATLH